MNGDIGSTRRNLYCGRDGLLASPGLETEKGRRDRAILSVLLYHGLRREHLMVTAGQPGFRLEALASRTVATDYLVSFETNRYSVPFRLIGETVQVTICSRALAPARPERIGRLRYRPEDSPTL